jgi:hypothetical protein
MCRNDQSGPVTKKVINVSVSFAQIFQTTCACLSLFLHPSHDCSSVTNLCMLLFCPALAPSLNTALSFTFLSSLTLTGLSVTDKALTVFVFLLLPSFSFFSCTDLVLLDPVAPLGLRPLTLLSSSLCRVSSVFEMPSWSD